jgi:uncharacterized protein YneF (UPF0154 family)
MAIMVAFLSMFIAAVLVGFMAQRWKGRTGAAWWFLTMVLQLLAQLCIAYWVVGDATHRELLQGPPIGLAAFVTLSIVLGAGAAAVIVATLPNRGRSWK